MRSSRLVALGMLLCVPLGAQRALASARPTVALVTSSRIGPFEQATNAMLEALRRNPLQPEILTFDLEGAQENASAVLARVRAAEPALLISVGSLATAAVLHESWPMPVVFSMVLYPRQSGFVSEAGHPVTGASLDVPLDVQFRALRRLLPKAERVGVLFHAGETGALIEAARAEAPRHGFRLDAVAVESAEVVLRTLTDLLGRVDVVWTVADSHVFTPQTTSEFILGALRRGVPIFGLSTAHVRTGALAAFSCDYADVGVQTAELALRILKGEKAATIPPTVPRKVSLALNMRTAHHLGVEIAPELEREAGEVVR